MSDIVDKRSAEDLRDRDMHGGATAELALILPFMLLAVLGITDFARACFHTIAVANAAHAGAKFGAHSPNNSLNELGIHNAVLAELGDTMQANEVTIVAGRHCECPDDTQVDCEDGTCGLENAAKRIFVDVRVERPFETLFQYPGLPGSFVLVREAHVRAR
jgi:hypothetical protein